MLTFPAIAVLPAITTTTLTLGLTHANTYLRFTNASGCTVTVDTQSSVGWVPFTEVHLRDETGLGTHGITVTSNSPAVINGVTSRVNATAVNGATLFLKNVATDSWDLGGHLAIT